MVPSESSDLQEEMQNTGNDKYVGTYKRLFLKFL